MESSNRPGIKHNEINMAVRYENDMGRINQFWTEFCIVRHFLGWQTSSSNRIQHRFHWSQLLPLRYSRCKKPHKISHPYRPRWWQPRTIDHRQDRVPSRDHLFSTKNRCQICERCRGSYVVKSRWIRQRIEFILFLFIASKIFLICIKNAAFIFKNSFFTLKIGLSYAKHPFSHLFSASKLLTHPNSSHLIPFPTYPNHLLQLRDLRQL